MRPESVLGRVRSTLGYQTAFFVARVERCDQSDWSSGVCETSRSSSTVESCHVEAVQLARPCHRS